MNTVVPITNIPQAQYGSDVVVDLLRALDIEYVSLNPGATFRGLHDSLVNYGGNIHPEMILCNHENIAVSMAAGYGLAAGRPMAAIVHNVVGLLNATNAIYNAWLSQAPVLILGGTGPMAVERRRPWIDWIHTALVQGNAVRDYVKWDDQPNSVPGAIDAVLRGYKIAMSEPRGPIYICLDTPIQEDPLAQPVSLPDVARFAPPTPIYPDPQALNKAAQMLVSAQRPVVMVDFLEQEKDVAALTELAEMLSLPVIDLHSAMSFPNTHALNMSEQADEALSQADLVVALNVHYLFHALTKVNRATRLASYCIPDTARIVDFSLRHLAWRGWSNSYGRLQATDLSITASTGHALAGLVEQCRQLLADQPGRQDRMQESYRRIQATQDTARQQWKQQVERRWKDVPVSLPRLASELWEVIKDEDWVLTNSTLSDWVWRIWKFTSPGQFVRREGLGCGIGHAMGVTLAYRPQRRLCIDIQPDGDMLFATSALWTAAHYHIPLLIVMFNNRSYYNDVVHQEVVARNRGRPVENKVVAMDIDKPAVDFARLASAYGIYAQGPVEEPDQLRPALERSVQHIKETGEAALVDVVTQSR